MSCPDLNLDLADLWLLPRWTITQMFFYCQAQIGGKRLRRSHRGRELCPIRRLIALYDFGPKVLYFLRPVLLQSKRFLIENGQNIKKVKMRPCAGGTHEISQNRNSKFIQFSIDFICAVLPLFNGHSNGRSPLFEYRTIGNMSQWFQRSSWWNGDHFCKQNSARCNVIISWRRDWFWWSPV